MVRCCDKLRFRLFTCCVFLKQVICERSKNKSVELKERIREHLQGEGGLAWHHGERMASQGDCLTVVFCFLNPQLTAILLLTASPRKLLPSRVPAPWERPASWQRREWEGPFLEPLGRAARWFVTGTPSALSCAAHCARPRCSCRAAPSSPGSLGSHLLRPPPPGPGLSILG